MESGMNIWHTLIIITSRNTPPQPPVWNTRDYLQGRSVKDAWLDNNTVMYTDFLLKPQKNSLAMSTVVFLDHTPLLMRIIDIYSLFTIKPLVYLTYTYSSTRASHYRISNTILPYMRIKLTVV